MSKILALVATAALFAGATAFAQDNTTTTETKSPPAAAAPTGDAASGDMASDGAKHHGMHRHHIHHHDGSQAMRGGKDTDWSADKLNACMVNATPTAEQENCLKQASRS